MNRISALIFLLSFITFSQEPPDPLLTPDMEAQTKWVDSVYNSLDLNEKIAQLYMVQVFSNQDTQTKKKVLEQVKDLKIGGIIYSKGGPMRQAELNNELQAVSKTPLLIGMDAEWGLSMRLDSTYAFPWNMTLGAISDNNLVQKAGQHIGEHCKRLGVHFNFAPVVDINTNPDNPIIGNRSFGEDKEEVTTKALHFMKGMQQAGVLANAKHFPGHGDTSQDSHKTLPTIDFSKERIDSVELYPYKKLIEKGLSSVMVAHLNVPSLEAQFGLPSSLSKTIVTDILKEKLGFKGLIFTDALNMRGAADFDETGDIDLAAFLAGNDVLLISVDVHKGIEKLKQAYEVGRISEERLSHSVKKILKAKYKVGLNDYKPVGMYNLTNELNRPIDDALYEELMENAITVLKNDKNVLPITRLETKSIAYVELGDGGGEYFYDQLKKYDKVTKVSSENLDDLIRKLNRYNTVIVGYHKSDENPWKSHEFKNKELVWLYEIARTNNVIFTSFTKPYALSKIRTIANIEGIVLAYQNSKIGQEKAAQLIFGGISAKGKLPVSVAPLFNQGDGVVIPTASRLSYGTPESVGMSSERLKRVDSVAQLAVDSLMTPGIQLLIARRGKVIYNKNFGYHTYDKKRPVRFDDVYDVASLTKILSTMPLLMELVDKGRVGLNTKLSRILPEFEGSNKEDITIKEMLSHYARLRPWIPFYINTVDSITKRPLNKYYRSKPSKGFNIEVAKNLYLRSDYQDSIPEIIKESELLSRLRYRYSDLPYYLIKEYIERYYGESMDKLIQQRFYRSIGANYATYNPYKWMNERHIIPTELDDYFRHQEIKGYVHDMGAAMQNGVGGHAGIFSNANDVAKIMQMFLQKGYYGGKRYFKTSTMDAFNTCYFCEDDNRRGVGFDKPQLGEEGPTCGCLSMTSFGHSGFTGTYTWADPEEGIIYVFLANRTYPMAGKNLLLRRNIRTEIQRLIYEAIDD